MKLNLNYVSFFNWTKCDGAMFIFHEQNISLSLLLRHDKTALTKITSKKSGIKVI